ncbi:hypothetical protein FCM35_KLT08478 [Carex littledalei]|uniref:Uncharacterized protein n=1 Tax=Carex littledalei TaxID=544730 RepID=A0A833VKI8_9POAL|nr:hypothetical protein FCM35_KLT08478 [Carex littledalei]
MRHHKNVLVHSSVRLPALQAKVGPPPGAARVAVVGAGVVLACALGAMYWKRARALQLPMHHSSQTSHGGGNDGDHLASGIVSIEDLHDLLSEICIRKLDPKPPQLTKLIHQCLTEKDAKIVSQNQDLTSLLEENFPKTTPGEHDYNLGFVLILALISEKKYTKAKEICNQLRDVDASQFDNRPDIFLVGYNKYDDGHGEHAAMSYYYQHIRLEGEARAGGKSMGRL